VHAKRRARGRGLVADKSKNKTKKLSTPKYY